MAIFPFPLFTPLIVVLFYLRQASNVPSSDCYKIRSRIPVITPLAAAKRNSAGDEEVTKATTATTRVIRLVLDQLKDSSFIEEKHQEHVQNPGVTHLFKGTPVAAMSEELKLQFVGSWAGRALAAIMQEEQDYLGGWKIQKILEAAGTVAYDMGDVNREIDATITSHAIVVYSFIDCPWCLAAKALLQEYDEDDSNDTRTRNASNSSRAAGVRLAVVELESLGAKGKAFRAELAKRTGRTSMPCIFVNGHPIGGYTDGGPIGVGLQVLHETGELRKMMLDNTK